jgi:hypothetical protein
MPEEPHGTLGVLYIGVALANACVARIVVVLLHYMSIDRFYGLIVYQAYIYFSRWSRVEKRIINAAVSLNAIYIFLRA